MAKFKKAILKANREYQSPDGPVFVDRERLAHWVSQFGRMRDAGLSVPCSWGHDDDPEKGVPTRLASADKRRRLPQDTVGYLRSVELTEDGDAAEIEIDVRRKADVEACDLNLAYVSPVIRKSWKDGDGEVWDDCWGHMDLVQHPVDHRQTPFERVEESSEQTIACALRMGLDDGTPATWRLADSDKGTKSMADDEKTSDSGDSETSEVEDMAVTDDGGRLKKVLDALAGMGIVLSDDTNEENFLEHVEQALLTAAAVNGEGDAAMPEDEGDLEVTAPQFAAMSLERSKEKKYIDKQHQKTIGARLQAVLDHGQCTPHEAKEHRTKVATVRLSLDDNGDSIPSGLETWISSREAVPNGTFWPSEERTRMGALDPIPHPPGLHGDKMPDDEAKKLADGILGAKS
jgi:hypothetical protein